MTTRQNAHLTFKENVQAGRHGWLRLTPAYSYRLVEDTLGPLDRGLRVLDPFSGSGTTGLVAAQLGFDATLTDLNPFLIWLAQAKTRNYPAADLDRANDASDEACKLAATLAAHPDLWLPPMHEIERWWGASELRALAALHAALDKLREEAPWFDLLDVALCRTVIATSNAAFNHQSMSFQPAIPGQERLAMDSEVAESIARFQREAAHVIESARPQLEGGVRVIETDARRLEGIPDASADVLYSSPPYANRMSYIRELRPYMYWLRYLTAAREAGELDWQAIGGTWGVATSRVGAWTPTVQLPIDDFAPALESIRASGARNADLLARYVHKYFADMADHFRAAARVLSVGGRVFYVIGNSVFYGVVVHSERWYADLLMASGFGDVRVENIRKRNSKKELYEYVVSAARL